MGGEPHRQKKSFPRSIIALQHGVRQGGWSIYILNFMERDKISQRRTSLIYSQARLCFISPLIFIKSSPPPWSDSVTVLFPPLHTTNIRSPAATDEPISYRTAAWTNIKASNFLMKRNGPIRSVRSKWGFVGLRKRLELKPHFCSFQASWNIF